MSNQKRVLKNFVLPDPTLASGYVEASAAVSIPIEARSIELVGANGMYVILLKTDQGQHTRDAIAELQKLIDKPRPGKLIFEFATDYKAIIPTDKQAG